MRYETQQVPFDKEHDAIQYAQREANALGVGVAVWTKAGKGRRWKVLTTVEPQS